MEIKDFESLRYLQMRCRLWKLVCKFIKFITNRGAFHDHTKLFEEACTVPCFWTQNNGLEVASIVTAVMSGLAINTPLRPELGWCRGDNKNQ